MCFAIESYSWGCITYRGFRLCVSQIKPCPWTVPYLPALNNRVGVSSPADDVFPAISPDNFVLLNATRHPRYWKFNDFTRGCMFAPPTQTDSWVMWPPIHICVCMCTCTYTWIDRETYRSVDSRPYHFSLSTSRPLHPPRSNVPPTPLTGAWHRAPPRHTARWQD